MGRKGLRIDVRMRDTFTGRELWIDATCVHVRVPLAALASANPAPPNQTTPPPSGRYPGRNQTQVCRVRATARNRCQAAPGRQLSARRPPSSSPHPLPHGMLCPYGHDHGGQSYRQDLPRVYRRQGGHAHGKNLAVLVKSLIPLALPTGAPLHHRRRTRNDAVDSGFSRLHRHQLSTSPSPR